MVETNMVIAEDQNEACHPSWIQTDTHTYSQPYGFQETLYNAISKPVGSPGLFLVGSSIQFKYPASHSSYSIIPLLQNAWLQMRYQYPGLAAENRSNGKMYQAPSTLSEVEDWLNETFLVISGEFSSTVKYWENMVKTKQMTICYFPDERKLFVQVEHHILDGRGVMNFWDRFFETVVNPNISGKLIWSIGSEISRLPARSDDLLNMAVGQDGALARAKDLLTPLLDMANPIAMPVPDGPQPAPPINGTVQLRLSAPTTDYIVGICKENGLSPTAAWHAATIFATQSIQAKRGISLDGGKEIPTTSSIGSQFGILANFDLRRYLSGPRDNISPFDAYAIGNHHCMLPSVVNIEDKTYAQVARELHAYYQRDLRRYYPKLWSTLGPMIRELIPPFCEGILEEKTPALSSIGVLDNFIRPAYLKKSEIMGNAENETWKIEDIWVGDTVTGPWLENFLWTWQGHMTLNTCYNQSYYTLDEVNEFLQLVLEKLVGGLALMRKCHL